MRFVCDRCGYESDRQPNFLRHLNAVKRKCRAILNDIPIEHVFAKYNLGSKMKDKSQERLFKIIDYYESFGRNEQVKPNELNEIKKTCERLEEKINDMSSKTGSVYNTYINNGNITNNVIQLNAYGKENTDYITKESINKYLELPYEAAVRIIKDIHFNKNHPENHNIKIKTEHNKKLYMFAGEKWVIHDVGQAVKDIHRQSMELVKTKMNNEHKSSNYYTFKNYNENERTKKDVLKNTECLIRNKASKGNLIDY